MNTKGVVGAHWEQQIFPIVSFTLSAQLDHAEAKSEFGVGLTVTL